MIEYQTRGKQLKVSFKFQYCIQKGNTDEPSNEGPMVAINVQFQGQSDVLEASSIKLVLASF
jgi:hypothetical protein